MPQYQQKPKHTPQPVEPAGKLQPQAIELEEMVLGALMLEKDAYTEVCDLLVPDAFYDPRNQKIYDAISRLGANQRPIDMLTVIEQLRSDGTLDEVGGAVAITDLTARVTSAAHIEYHARIIAQKYLARRLIAFSSSVQTSAFDESNDIDDLLQKAEGELFEISQTQLKREVVQVDSVITQALQQIDAASKITSGLSGLPSGYTDLDKLTSGWQNDNLIIIAARPAMGKTAFVLSMAKNMAVDYNIPVGVFSLEMSNIQLVNRLISNVCEITGDKIRSGRLDDSEWQRLNSRVNYLFGAPLYIDETPGLSITELRTKARRLVREHDVKIIIIDYLQLMNATGMKFGSREQEVSTISRSLKALSKELKIPIIALSQLNRSTETREDKRPVLSDLRESGAIEQDADFVAFIHRPEYYTRSSTDAEGNDIRGLAEFIVAKHRAGQVDTIKMRFVDKYVRFENWENNLIVKRMTVESRMNKESDGEAPAIPDAPSVPQMPDSPLTSSPFDTPMPDILPGPGTQEPPF
ncbi:MAG: replicative DNA helicase [Muribaculaceae bacterium]|nr:replicative DNA helicase [Muribaculaceae bacterium]